MKAKKYNNRLFNASGFIVVCKARKNVVKLIL